MVGDLMPLDIVGLEVRRRGKRLLGPITHRFGLDGLTMVIGPNGAGKTTFLKALHGIERISAGDLRWATSPEDAKGRQAYVFQTPTMLRRSVRENLAYPLRLNGVRGGDLAKTCEAWAERINLSDALERPAPRLSGGERQKLAIARALISGPDLLFLDEPCANLDGSATADIERMLADALDQGTRIIMTSHDVGQVRRLAHDFLFLHGGQIREAGSSGQLNDPQSIELKSFLKGDILR
nr:ATP-binding cassette domain-containing protein [uncultured Tateyamaria sp.]